MSAGSVSAALDPTAPAPYKQGREFVQRVVLTLTDSYVTGGVAVDLTGLNTPGLSMPFAWAFFPQFGDTYEYVLGTDRSDGLIKAYTGGTQHTSDAAWAEATLKAEFRYRGMGD